MTSFPIPGYGLGHDQDDIHTALTHRDDLQEIGAPPRASIELEPNMAKPPRLTPAILKERDTSNLVHTDVRAEGRSSKIPG